VDRPATRPAAAPVRARDPRSAFGRGRVAQALAVLSLVAGCGGGGGGGSTPASPGDGPGLAGSVAAPDVHLGRISEREPNDTQAQRYRLPPAHARTQLEVVGNLAATAGYAGAADVADVLRYVVLADSSLAITLTYLGVDPVSGGQNLLRLEARDAAGVLLDADEGPSPLGFTLVRAAGEPVYLHVLLLQGHTPWVLGATASDAAAPSPKRTSPAAPALRIAADDAPEPPARACCEEHVLVRLKPGVDAAAWAARHGHVLGEATALGTCRVRLAAGGPAAAKPRAASEAFLADPDVAWSEPDWVVLPLGAGDDPELARQWGLHAIGAPDAWEITRGDAAVVVGVIDSGVVDHPDLEGQTVAGYDFVSDAGMAADGDGRDADPTDVGDRGGSGKLSTWHGTHVAAIIAGRGDDATGVSGVAPGCRVMALRALGRGGGLVSDVADAVLFAAGQFTTEDGRRLAIPLRVVNLSLGTAAASQELEDACNIAAAQGTLLVAATGNDGGAVLYPARYGSVLAVSAVGGLLTVTPYSNSGAEVSLCAPGGTSLSDLQGDGWPDSILSAVRDGTLIDAPMAWGYLTGTSQAAPHVAAVAAMMVGLDPTQSRVLLRQRLEQTALDRGVQGADDAHGHGLVQAQAALALVKSFLGEPISTPARLHLPVPAVRFVGLESLRRVPLVNSGTGVLAVSSAQSITDDGASWLGATLLPAFAGADISSDEIEVLIDRAQLPAGPGWASGTLRLYGPTGGLGLLRVTVATGAQQRAGTPFRLVAIDTTTGGVRSDGYAHPQNDYRYVLGGLPAGTYRVKGGEDLDVDGFFCESYDLCGWYGGPLEQDALDVDYAATGRLEGIDLTLTVFVPP
jgi:serine protease